MADDNSGYRWWIKAVGPMITALIAAPATGAVVTCGLKSREMAIQESERSYKLLDRAIDRAREPADRRVVLHFIAMAGPDDPMRNWAKAELKDVQIEIDAKQSMAETAGEMKRLVDQMADYKANIDKDPPPPDVGPLTKKYEEGTRMLDQLRKRYSDADSKLAPWMRPSGRTFPRNPTVDVTTLCNRETIRGGKPCLDAWSVVSNEVGINLDGHITWTPSIGSACTCTPRAPLREMLLP